MTFNELITLCKPLEVMGNPPEGIGALVQDSRKVTEGSVFIAVRGTQTDGHKFIGDAVSNGASVIICEEMAEAGPRDVCMLLVEDTRRLVSPLAQAFEGNPAEALTLLGVTGTNGKTTVATLTFQVLQALETKPALLGTAGKRIMDEVSESRLTTSDPIELASDMRQMAEAGATHLVMEVSSHALDQQRVAGLRFKVAAYTNLSHDHLDYHDTLEEYAESKKKLFDALDQDSTAVVNADDGYARFMLRDCKARTIAFGFEEAPEADVYCRVVSLTSDGIEMVVDGTTIRSPLTGSFNAYNVAQAFLICRALGFESPEIAAALKTAHGAPGRLERVTIEGKKNIPLVVVDYAHTPDALENILATLKDLKTVDQRLHVIFGCGGNRDKGKRPKMAEVAERYADLVTVTSDNPRNEDPEAIIDEIMAGFDRPAAVRRNADRKQAIEEAIAEGDPDAIILIAGKGHETYQEINGKRHHFDDREIARNALGRLNGNPKPEEVA